MSLYVTTAGYNLLGVVLERGPAAKVLQNVFEADHFGGCIYTLDEGDDWTDESEVDQGEPDARDHAALGRDAKRTPDAQHSPDSRASSKPSA